MQSPRGTGFHDCRPRPSKALAGAWVGCAALALVAGCGQQVPDAVNGHFDFNQHAFTFTNFDLDLSGGQMTPALAERMFGTAAVCASGTGNDCLATSAAELWIEEVNATLNFGHSEGIAVLSLLMSMGKVNPADFGADNAAALHFDAKLRAELAYWSATQKLQAVHQNDKKLAANEVLPFLAEALKDQNEGWRLLVAQRDETGFHAGHAVVPFGYFKGERNGQYFIRIYDSNFPTQERRIELDTVANTWSYDGSSNPDLPRPFQGDSANGNLLYFSPVTPRLGTLTPPFIEGFSVSTSQGMVLVQGSGDGTQVGFVDGKVVEKGGTLLPGAADCFCKAPSGITNVMVNASGPQTVAVGADAGTLYASSPTVSAKVSGSNGAGAITVDPSSKQVTYNSTGDGGTSITTTTKNADGSQTTVTVTVDKPAASITVDASDPNDVKVQADVSTAPTKVSVQTTVTQPDGSSKTTSAQGTTSGGNDVSVSVDAQAGTSTVNSNVNYATCLNGKKDPMEADVDCGSFCAMQAERHGNGLCASGSTCTHSSDCAIPDQFPKPPAGECFGGFCVWQSCFDGRQNQDETSIDCGGSCPCPLGSPCTPIPGCRVSNGLSCLDQVCQAVTQFQLTVTGLGTDGIALMSSHDAMASYSVTANGVASNAPVLLHFGAVKSLTVGRPADARYHCTFDSADAQGNWVVSSISASTPKANTLRCQPLKTDVGYTTNDTGCPFETEVTPPGSAVRVWERFPLGPTLTLAAVHPAIQTYNGSAASAGVFNSTQLRPVAFSGLQFAADGGAYDGGTAFSASIGPAVDAYSTYQYNTINELAIAALAMPRRQYHFGCSAPTPATGPFQNAPIALQLSCTCTLLVPDAGPADAGSADGGPDAGTGDGGVGCTLDSDCSSSNDCVCAANPGNCAGGSGQCGAGKYSVSTPTTDGVAASGSYTVPAGCTAVRLEAWGAAGGNGQMAGFGPPLANAGGAGGFVSGTLSVAPGDVLTVWVGQAGALAANMTAGQGTGSSLGTPANGGLGDGLFNQSGGGSGGGLTSLLQRRGGSPLQSFSVPGGGGGGANQPADPAGGASSGNAASKGGTSASGSSTAGGGGAGENGGTAGTSGGPGIGGAFGTLPAGLSSFVGSANGAPAGTSLRDYSTVCGGTAGQAGLGGSSGNGCVVVRCVP